MTAAPTRYCVCTSSILVSLVCSLRMKGVDGLDETRHMLDPLLVRVPVRPNGSARVWMRVVVVFVSGVVVVEVVEV